MVAKMFYRFQLNYLHMKLLSQIYQLLPSSITGRAPGFEESSQQIFWEHKSNTHMCTDTTSAAYTHAGDKACCKQLIAQF